MLYFLTHKIMSRSLVESHKNLLKQIDDETLLYKVVPFEFFLKMLERNYLYFTRVDTYVDDKKDSDQPEQERLRNEQIYFEKDPDFTLRKYYEECRRRTYACCFSLDVPNEGHWKRYGGEESEKAVCLVMNFGKLKLLLNDTFERARLVIDNSIVLENHADGFSQIFHLNYGVVKYGDFANDVVSVGAWPNPLEYAYFKDENYREENELRISLSAVGMGKIILPYGKLLNFPESIRLEFSFDRAVSCGALSHIEISNQNFAQEFAEKMNGRKLFFGDCFGN